MAPSRSLVYAGSVASGKTSLICNLATSVIPKPALLVVPGSPHLMQSRLNLPLTAPVTVSSISSLAETVLNSEIGALFSPMAPPKTIMSATSRTLLMHQLLPSLPLDRFRPAAHPTRFVQQLSSYFSSLANAHVTPQAYAAYSAAAQPSEHELLSPSEHQELSACYTSLWKHKTQMGLIDSDEAVHLAALALEASLASRPHVDHSALLLPEPLGLLALDDGQDLTAAGCALFAHFALATRAPTTVCCGDWASSIQGFRGASRSNLPTLQAALPNCEPVVVLPAPPASPSQSRALVQARDELACIAHWAAPRPRTVVAARSRRDCADITAFLTLRGLPVRSKVFVSLFATDEVRTALALLRAILRPDNNDREIVALLDSPLLPHYRPPAPLQRTARSATRLKDQLKDSPLLTHLAQLSALSHGLSLPELVLQAFTLSGLAARPIQSRRDDLASRRLAALVEQIALAHDALAGPPAADTLTHLELLAELGGVPDVADWDAPDSKNSTGVVVVTLHALCSMFDPHSLESLVIARAADASRRRSRRGSKGFSLPRQWQTQAPDSEQVLLEQALARLSPTGELLVTCSDKDRPSPLFAARWALAGFERAPEPPPPIVVDPATMLPLSYSRLVEFEQCPLKYYTLRVLGVQVSPRPEMVRGKALHKAAEALCLGATLAQAEQAFRSVAAGPEFEEGVSVIAGMAARARPHPPRLVEHAYEFDWQGAKVAVVIDLVETLPSGGACVVDFKSNTAEPAKLRSVARDPAQLAMYAWALEHEFGTPPETMAIESLETGRRVEMAYSPQLVEAAQARLGNMLEALRRGQFVATPGVYTCSICPLKDTCFRACR